MGQDKTRTRQTGEGVAERIKLTHLVPFPVKGGTLLSSERTSRSPFSSHVAMTPVVFFSHSFPCSFPRRCNSLWSFLPPILHVHHSLTSDESAQATSCHRRDRSNLLYAIRSAHESESGFLTLCCFSPREISDHSDLHSHQGGPYHICT